uniref:Uncharacterized protein n=1 Tax=Oryza rufipogon TaxID=4529 RepID=A0A0E0QUP3_ORYRU
MRVGIHRGVEEAEAAAGGATPRGAPRWHPHQQKEKILATTTPTDPLFFLLVRLPSPEPEEEEE